LHSIADENRHAVFFILTLHFAKRPGSSAVIWMVFNIMLAAFLIQYNSGGNSHFFHVSSPLR
jgi:hypothetical protein